MRFIEVRDSLSVCVDEIEAVAANGDGSVVYTHHNTYESTFPYLVLLQLLESEEVNPEDEKINEGLEGFLKNVGTFAG